MKGHDKRVVSFEYIHNIKPKDFERLITAVRLKNNDRVLEVMCGYGSVSKKS